MIHSPWPAPVEMRTGFLFSHFGSLSRPCEENPELEDTNFSRRTHPRHPEFLLLGALLLFSKAKLAFDKAPNLSRLLLQKVAKVLFHLEMYPILCWVCGRFEK